VSSIDDSSDPKCIYLDLLDLPSLSASVVCCLTYLSEFTKVSLRPRVLTIMSYAIGLSLIYVPCKNLYNTLFR